MLPQLPAVCCFIVWFSELFLCRRGACGLFWKSCGIREALCLRAESYTFCMASVKDLKQFMTKAMHTGTKSKMHQAEAQITALFPSC